jgi:hypothetical protein
MSSSVGKALVLVGSIALIATGVGSALGAAGIASLAAMSGTLATISLIATGLTLAGSLMVKKPKASPAATDRLTVSFDPSTPRKLVVGHTALATDLRYQGYTGAKQEYYHQILACASHAVEGVDELWFDSELAWSSAGGVSAKYAGYLEVAPRLEGSAGNAIAIDGLWNSNARLTGCAYIHLRFKLTGNTKTAESPFSSNVPSRLTIRGRAAKLYDPRLDSTAGGSGPQRANDQATWAYSPGGRNPALQLLFYLLGWRINGKLAVGRGIPASRIDLGSFITAANMCDEAVTRAAGGIEPRYRADGIFSEADGPEEVITAFCASMNATLRDAGGRIALTVLSNDLGLPKTHFTENDILGEESWKQTPDITDTFNVLRGRFTDPSDTALYQLVDFPEVSLPSLDGIERVDSLELALVQSPSQAQRLAKQRLQRNQYQGLFSAQFNARAWQVNLGDVITLSHASLGWDHKLFRVVGHGIERHGITQLLLQEEHPSIYAWDAEEAPAVQAGVPTIYDPANDPIRNAIQEASESGEVDWPDVNDSLGTKPQDNATVGAPPGTVVNDRLAEDVTTGLDTNTGTINSHTSTLSSHGQQLSDILLDVDGLHQTYGSTAAAADSANAASASAFAAANYEQAAAIAQQAAEDARDASDLARQTADLASQSAANSATAAGNSASAASGHASTASTKADEASQSASAASGSANTASTSAGNASSSASQAATSATNAQGSANSAASQATNAANSATAAGNSASAASGHASTASTKADEASQSASAASSSANTATTSAGNASTSAGSAALSETNAAGSASTAATSATTAATAAKESTINSRPVALTAGGVGFTDQPGTNLFNTPPGSQNVTFSNGRYGFNAPTYTGLALHAYFPIAAGRIYEVQAEYDIVNSGPPDSILLGAGYAYYNAAGEYLGYAWNWSHTQGVNTTGIRWGGPIRVATAGTPGSLHATFPSDAVYARPFLWWAQHQVGAQVRFVGIRSADVTDRIKAEAEASAAATSASTASTKATEASQSASSASTSANTASTKAGEASTSASSAATSATNASGSANTASTQATNAANSATNAGNSASAAATSASTASTKASEATTSATSATTAANTAQGHANNASTSASSASSSAATASGSASSATQSATLAASLVSQGFPRTFEHEGQFFTSSWLNGHIYRASINDPAITFPHVQGGKVMRRAGNHQFGHKAMRHIRRGRTYEMGVRWIKSGNNVDRWNYIGFSLMDANHAYHYYALQNWMVASVSPNPHTMSIRLTGDWLLDNWPNAAWLGDIYMLNYNEGAHQPGEVSDVIESWFDDITEMASVQATVQVHSGAISTLSGKAVAYWQLRAGVSTGAAAFIEAMADNNGSNVAIGAREFHVYNQGANGLFSRAMSVAGGRVLVHGDMDVGGAMRIGTRRIAIALQSFKLNASDGQNVSFGTDLTNLPKIEFDTSALPSLASGQAYDIKALNLSPTGFTMYAKIITSGTSSNVTATGGVATGGTPNYRMHKPGVQDAANGNYTFAVTAQTFVPGMDFEPGAGVMEVDCYVRPAATGVWTFIGTISKSVINNTGSATWITDSLSGTVYYGDAISMTADYEFGVMGRNNTQVSAFSSVSYTTQSSGGATSSVPQSVPVTVVPQNQ